jgi:hypothetical protein
MKREKGSDDHGREGVSGLMGRCGFESAKRRLGNGAVLALIRTIIMFPRGGVWHRV